MLSSSSGDLAGRVLLIGHMGPSAYPLSPVIALTALGRALRGFGVKADVGAAVEAALAALDLPRAPAVTDRASSAARRCPAGRARSPLSPLPEEQEQEEA